MGDLPFANVNAEEVHAFFSNDYNDNMSVNNQIDFSMLDFTSELDLIEDEDDVFEEQWNTDPDKNILIDSKNQCSE